jgi:hypothetical protein
MLNHKIFKIDSAYLDEEILAETQRLLHDYAFTGALDEFEQARNHYENSRFREAVIFANNAVESTLKTILGETYAKKKTGELIKGLIKSDYIPSYLSNNIINFKELLEMPQIIRSNEGGHGSGEEKLSIAPEYAQFMLHLSGSLIHYLIKLYICRHPQVDDENVAASQESDVDIEPF